VSADAKLSKLDVALRPIFAITPKLEKLLPTGMNLDRFMMQVRLALMKQPKLQECTPLSLLGAVLEAADLGLDPSGRLGSAYLIPFNGVVTLVPGYRGLIDLAARSGMIRSVNAYAVHEKDVFNVRAGMMPEHIPYIPRRDGPQDAGPWFAVWARARLAGGGVDSEVMTYAEIMKIKARSPGARKAGGPWDTDEEEMAKKTVIRRLLKKMPLSPSPQWDKLARALDMNDGAVIEGEHRSMTPLEDLFAGPDVELPTGDTGDESSRPQPKATTASKVLDKLAPDA